jgi:hypothetical protein
MLLPVDNAVTIRFQRVSVGKHNERMIRLNDPVKAVDF